MKRILLALAMLALPSSLVAQTSQVRIIGRAADGTDRPILATTDGKLQVDASGAGGGGASAGDVANDAVDSGNPVKIGGRASTTAPSAVAAADRVNAWYTLNGAAVSSLVDPSGNSLATASGFDNMGNVNGVGSIAHNFVFNGTGWDRLRGSTVGVNVQGAAANGAAVSGNPVLIAGSNGTNAYRLATDNTGTLAVPQAGTGNRTVTHTNLASNTSTTICPAATNPISTEIYFTTAGVGISLSGGTLASAAVGASNTTTPDIVISTAGTLYTLPVASSNAITAYGAAGYITCIQTVRP